MAITTLSSRDFNRDTSRAKKAANDGPVFITDRGRPSHVLLSIEEYCRITRTARSLVSLLAMDGGDDIDFEPPKLDRPFSVPADLGADAP